MKNEIVLFTDGDTNLEVELSPELETVWLTQKQMEELFDVKHATVSEHISNILASGELDETSVGFSDKSSGGRKPKIYNLDMILSVGYRVNSKRGIAFRRWANSVLKQYAKTSNKIKLSYIDVVSNPTYIQANFPNEELNTNSIIVRCNNKYKIITVNDIFDISYGYYGNQSITASKAEQELTSALVYVTSENQIKIAFYMLAITK